MYHQSIDSPVAQLDYLRQGGGAVDYRDKLINDMKVRAADAFAQQYAKSKAEEMHLALDQRRFQRNLEAQQVNWPLQLGGLLAVVVLVVGVKKFM